MYARHPAKSPEKLLELIILEMAEESHLVIFFVMLKTLEFISKRREPWSTFGQRSIWCGFHLRKLLWQVSEDWCEGFNIESKET